MPNEGWDTIAIYIPPGFTVPGARKLCQQYLTTIRATLFTLPGPYDRYGPGWTVVYVEADTITNADSATLDGSLVQLTTIINSSTSRQPRNGTMSESMA